MVSIAPSQRPTTQQIREHPLFWDLDAKLKYPVSYTHLTLPTKA